MERANRLFLTMSSKSNRLAKNQLLKIPTNMARLELKSNTLKCGGVLKSMLTLNEAIIDVKEG